MSISLYCSTFRCPIYVPCTCSIVLLHDETIAIPLFFLSVLYIVQYSNGLKRNIYVAVQ